MSLHEPKYCPRCSALIECKVGSILLCQCAAVDLSDEERNFIKVEYEDCLCVKCLLEMRSIFHEKKHDERMRGLLRR